MRTFISLDLPKEIIEEIVKIQKLIKKQSLFTGKFIESENLHLTLKFLGEIDEEKVEEVKKRLKSIKIEKEIFAELGEAGVFSKSFVKIIWIKLNGKGIFELQKQIDDKLKDLFPVEERFMSHITIVRVKHTGDKKGLLDYLKSVKPKGIKFLVKEFSFKKSELKPEGPVYESIEDYELV